MGIAIWEMIIVGLIAYFIYYKFIKKKPAEAEEKVEIETEARAETGIYFEDDGLREKVVNEINEWLQECWNNEDYKSTMHWYNDQVTERQIEALNSEGINAGKGISKGMASTLIGLFHDPSDDDISVLKYFKISTTKISDSKARYMAWKVMQSDENKNSYRHRKATTLEKEFIKFFGGKVGVKTTHKDYVKFSNSTNMPVEEDDPRMQLVFQWELIDRYIEEQKDFGFRESCNIKKVPISKIIEAVKSIQPSDKKRSDDQETYEEFYQNFYDDIYEDDLAEVILKKYPQYQL